MGDCPGTEDTREAGHDRGQILNLKDEAGEYSGDGGIRAGNSGTPGVKLRRQNGGRGCGGERGGAQTESEETRAEGYNLLALESRTWTCKAHNRMNPAKKEMLTSLLPSAPRKGDAGEEDENGMWRSK